MKRELLRLPVGLCISLIFLLTLCPCSFARMTLVEEKTLLEELEREVAEELLEDLLLKKENEMRETPNPHIILIIADDLGFADVGWNNEEMLTHDVLPNIQKLATNDGVILGQYYTEPQCGPSRSAIYTGLYPFRYGGQDNYGTRKRGLPLDITTLGTKMKEAGYTNHFVGKWHMGHCNSSYTPLERGYETFYGQYLGTHDDYFTHEAGGVHDLTNNTEVDPDDFTHTTDLYEDRIEEILNSHSADSPLFLVYADQLVHTPIAKNQVPASFFNKYKGQLGDARLSAYFAMLNMLDTSIGNLISLLKSKNMYDNSVIIFVSDNGQSNVKNSWVSRNNPLKQFKGSVFEGGIRVPAFVHSPGYLNSLNYVYDGMVYAADIFPTILSLSGLSDSSIDDLENEIDGLAMWESILTNSTSRRNTIVSVNTPERYYIREGDYKLIKYEETVQQVTQVKTHLFNIDDDPIESNDLKDNEQTKYNDLMAKLDGYINDEVIMKLEPKLAVTCNPADYGNVLPTDCCF